MTSKLAKDLKGLSLGSKGAPQKSPMMQARRGSTPNVAPAMSPPSQPRTLAKSPPSTLQAPGPNKSPNPSPSSKLRSMKDPSPPIGKPRSLSKAEGSPSPSSKTRSLKPGVPAKRLSESKTADTGESKQSHVVQRRRLSVVSTAQDQDATKHFEQDGLVADGDVKEEQGKSSKEVVEQGPISSFAVLSKVGYVPFNTTAKVNQDRATSLVNFLDNPEKAFFAVFDGHGVKGHNVSAFVATDLPKQLAKQKKLDNVPHEAIVNAFVACNSALCRSSIDCSYSGSTGVTLYMDGKTLYCANIGDSRAVLARKKKGGGLEAVALSIDQKPERKEEQNRILQAGGRIHACKGADGSAIGPLRVWLQDMDVPGLAMTRSFGDLLAASVGVIPVPEIIERKIAEDDVCIIMGSDGIWEFIPSQEAVNMIADCSDATEACNRLVAEARKRWQKEEEVIDDITCLAVYF